MTLDEFQDYFLNSTYVLFTINALLGLIILALHKINRHLIKSLYDPFPHGHNLSPGMHLHPHPLDLRHHGRTRHNKTPLHPR